MGTLDNLLVGLGLDASGYSSDVASAAEDTSRFVDRATSGFDRFSDVVTGALHKVGELAVDTGLKVGGALIDQGQQALDTAGKYESMMGVLQSTANATEEQMKRADALAIQLGDDASLPGASATSSMQAVVELTRRTGNLEESMDGARGTLQLAAAALGGDVVKAATIGANAMDIYGLQGEDLMKVNDQLVNTFKATGVSVEAQAESLEQFGPIAAQLNIPLDETQAMIGMLGKKGIEGSEAGNQLRGTFMSLMNPSNEAKNALADLNVEVYNLDGSMKSPIQLIEEFSKVQVGSQVTMRMTGDELEKIGKKAEQTRDQIGKLTEKNADLADKLEEQAAKLPKAIDAFNTKRIQAEEDYRDKLQKLAEDADQKREDLATKLGTKLLDIETGHQDKLRGIVEAATEKRAGIEADYGEKLGALAQDYQGKLQSLETDHQQKLVTAVEQAAEKRAGIETDYSEKLTTLAQSYQDKIADIATSYQQKQVDAAEKYHADIEKLEQAHATKVADIQGKIASAATTYQESQIDRAQAYQQKLADIERGYQEKIGQASESYQTGQEDRQYTHAEKLEDIESSYQNKVRQLQTKLAAATTDTQRAALKQQLAEAQIARDQAIADENERYTRAEDKAKRSYDRQLEQLKAAHDRQIEEAARRNAEEERKAEEAYAKQQAALAKQLAAEQTAYEQRRVEAAAAYAKQQADLDQQRDAALAKEQTQYQRQQQAAQQAHDKALADLDAALLKQQQAEERRYGEARAKADAEYAAQQQQAQAAHDKALTGLDAALLKQQAAEQAAYERSRQQAQTAYDQQLADVQRNLERQTTETSAAYTKQEQRAKQAFEASFGELSAGVQKRSAELQKEMAANDLALTEAEGKLANYSHTLETGGAHVETLTQKMRDQALATIFGRENMGAANIVLAGGTELYNDLTEKINKTGSAQELAAATTQGLEGAVSGLSSTWETLQLELGKAGLPVATEAMRVFTKLIADNKEGIKDFVNNTIIPLATKILDVAKGFTEASDKTRYLKDTIEQNSGPIADAIGGLALKAASVLGTLAPKIGVALLQGLEKGLNDQWNSSGGSAIVQLLTGGMWNLITAFWGINSPSTKMISMAGDLIAGLWSGFSSKAGDMGTNIYRWFDENIVHRMRGLLNTFPDIGRDISNSLWGGIRDTWNNNIAPRLGDLWNAIPESIRNVLQMHSPSRVLWGLGEQAGWSVAGGAEDTLGAVRDAGEQLGAALSSGVGPLSIDGPATGAAAPDVQSQVSADVPPTMGRERAPDTVSISIPDFNRLAEALRQYYIDLNRRQGLGF